MFSDPNKLAKGGRTASFLGLLLMLCLSGCTTAGDEEIQASTAVATEGAGPSPGKQEVDPVASTSGETSNAGADCENPDDGFGCYAVPTIEGSGALIVQSTGPSAAQFPIGLSLDPAGRITLAAGDRVTVLDKSGTRVLTGPGTFSIAARGASRRSAYAALTNSRPTARVRTGAVRGASSGPPPAPRMQVVRGDAGALAWYGIGRTVPVDARVCLPETARFITFERLDGGGQITYGGGDCNKAATPPTKGDDEEDGVWKGP